MAKSDPKHVVVDGSNIATEGRTAPSLKQLNEAVMAFMQEFPSTKVTVVVDATFGHRIDKKEVADFNSGIDNNELVAPPAGAVGRGDGFVLTIADKIGASILSNDSYQEFQDDYPWLFTEGRLYGGKPVPHVGWVFIQRIPVRPLAKKVVKKASREASRPMPVPKAPPPGAKLAAKPKPVERPKSNDTERGRNTNDRQKQNDKPKPNDKQKVTTVNELAPFLNFVEKYRVGSKVKGNVESYSAHGAYVRIGDVLGYLPLRSMATPPPRSAREYVKIGQGVSLVVASFTASRRSIDVAMAGLLPVEKPTDKKQVPAKAARAKKKKKRAAAPPARKAPARKK